MLSLGRLPLISGRLASWHATLLTFAAFCAVCSSIYVVNDLFDHLASDRAHPKS